MDSRPSIAMNKALQPVPTKQNINTMWPQVVQTHTHIVSLTKYMIQGNISYTDIMYTIIYIYVENVPYTI